MPKKTACPPASAMGDPGASPLTALQERLCDLAADLIINGGREKDVSNLLRAAAGHGLHLRFPHRDSTWTRTRIDDDASYWFPRISRHWPTPTTEPAPPPPKTVSEMARANVRRGLRSAFENFLGDARTSDLYLLCSILQDVESRSTVPESDTAESHLAEAFMLALDSDVTYVKVPSDHIETVEEFLKTLEAAPTGGAHEPRMNLVILEPRQSMTETAS